ncbi:MAG: aminotransferase class IV [Gemmataceae bacterium]
MSIEVSLNAIAYFDGHFVSPSSLAIPVADAGFVWGATATDRARTFAGKLFRLADHLARFRQSCGLARIPQPVPDDELTRIAERLVAHNYPLQGDLSLILFATPGPPGGPPTLGLHTEPIPFARHRHLFTDGATLVIPSVRHATPVDPRAKVRSRLFWWLAEQEAGDRDRTASAILLDAAGHVTETAAANFLAVIDGVVTSPPRATILNGVSLRVVEELCGELGVPFAERPLTPADCRRADEAMLTCTTYCLAGVRRFDGTELPWPGPLTQRLLAAWSARVGLDIADQFRA